MARHSRRRVLQGGLTLAGLGLLAGCGVLPPGAQPARIRRIGVLGEDSTASRWDAFREGLRELGYVDGQNLSIEYRWAQGDYGRLPAHVADLVDLEVACIVCGGITETTEARRGTSTIPVIAVLANLDIVETGLVANIGRPEGNVTGLAGVSGLRLYTKFPEILKEALPDLGRLAVLAHARAPSVEVILDSMREAARRLGLRLEVGWVQDTAGLEAAFAAFAAAGTGALAISNVSAFNSARARIAALSLAHRQPAITSDEEFPRAGGLMAYSVNRNAQFRRAAYYVDRILKGAKPAELPMERPSTFDFVINLQTARALGLTLPQTVLQQATEVIQ